MPIAEHPQMQEVFAASSSGLMRVGEAGSSEIPVLDGPPQRSPSDEPGLERDIELFLAACSQALKRALRPLPEGEQTEVVVLVAGRASRFGPIARLVKAQMPGRVVHLTNEWVRRSYGNTGQIDPTADLKTLTANGGGLFAVLHSHAETSHLVLSFDTNVMDTAVYLQPAANTRPWLLAEQLDLRPGQHTPLPGSEEPSSDGAGEEAASAEEPRPRPLPTGTPLAGDLKLVVEGLSEDRSWEPYVTIAVGTARRHHGRRPRTSEETALVTEQSRFVLGPLSDEREVVFTRILPNLELLGGGPDDTRGPEQTSS